MDRQWLRNLANSEYNQEGWQLADPSSPSYLAHTKVQDVLQKLYLKTKDAIDIFNMHADNRKKMRLYQLTVKEGVRPCGFAIMLKNLQVKLEQVENSLTSEAILMKGYDSARVKLRQYEPKFDTFGEVSWIMNGKAMLTHDAIVRYMLEDSLRLGYESGVIPYMTMTPKTPTD